MTPNEIARWPGKTFDTGTHPALWHMLDVGAVAKRLLQRNPLTGNGLQDDALAFLITLHDLGKISNAFRKMLSGQPYPAGPRHWQHSYRLFREHDALIENIVGGTEGARRRLYAAVAGHHGGPPVNLDHLQLKDQLEKQIGAAALAFSAQVIEQVATLHEGASLDGIDGASARRLGWVLCGQTVMADWIGSNSDWFPMQSPDIPLADYWEQAQARAETAIAAAGLYQTRPAPDGAAHVLGHHSPRPMQAAVADVTLPDGPVLAMIEDATGAGKTEAALILAARMMAAGKGRGIFFALPTMATSNAMLARLADVAPALFEGTPGLGLSHGKAHMNDLFREIRGGGSERVRDDVNCSDWLADDRRRVLLADVGVGTIDQALLAVLPTRFSALRLRALAGHILIVDEAHAYDPYMERELRGLLKFHAMLGGSAIVMTATLPMDMREGYAQAFRQGLTGPAQGGRRRRRQQEDTPLVAEADYPMLSILGQGGVETRAPDPVPATRRNIAVHRLTSEAEAVATLKGGVAKGAACVWVRNAVDDAIGAVEALRTQGIQADLLHARFTVADRLDKERILQARFGPEGQGRAGRVLVATQVVEASLDLDFDLMVSDLAPVGALVQRAGRLWRHMDPRPAHARPVGGPALHVLSPDPDQVEDERWLQTVLGAGAWVYPADVQWRTARVLFEAGMIRAPDGLRDLIEAVHGAAPADLPLPLENTGWQTEGNAMTEAQLAIANMPDPFAGYDQDKMRKVFDDEVFPTRLGREQITLRLARRQGGRLIPWAGEGTFGWQMSEVQISRARYEKTGAIDQDRPDIAALKKGWPEWKRKRVIVATVDEDGGIGSKLFYSQETGLGFL
jgi:CRISPR-associated endonuclease/helicase Cas3